MKLIECVPNFSEGKDQSLINKISESITSIEGVVLLDVDSGFDTNRTVITFVGEPQPVLNAAFEAIKTAQKLINLRNHTGAHARMGATDVCPLIPVKDISIEECIGYSKQLAGKVANELQIPIFLYEHSASNKERVNLANIRSGEFEGMHEKIKSNDWKPDFGKQVCHPSAGVTAIGCREFLIAYNINLNTQDRKLASDIALDIREAGRAKRDANRKFVRDDKGKIVINPGTLKSTKAVGWYMEEYKVAQVSMNLTNFKITSPHQAFEEVRKQAQKRGLRVTGSELVGLIPLNAILDAGKYYLKQQNRSLGIPDKDIIHIAVKSLGLDELAPFDSEKNIIEYQVAKKYGPLISMNIHEFVDELSSESPAPGGGSVSALAGSLAAGLSAMIANLTFGKKGYEDYFESMNIVGQQSQKLKDQLLYKIDEDTDAFNLLMDAFKLPKNNDSQITKRNKSIQLATKHASNIPFQILELCLHVLSICHEVALHGNKNSLSDGGVAAEMAHAGARGANMNVLINLMDIEDEKFINELKKKSSNILEQVNKKLDEIREIVDSKISL